MHTLARDVLNQRRLKRFLVVAVLHEHRHRLVSGPITGLNQLADCEVATATGKHFKAGPLGAHQKRLQKPSAQDHGSQVVHVLVAVTLTRIDCQRRVELFVSHALLHVSVS